MEETLRAIIVTGRVPADLTITYDDMHGLWGGTIITVYGDGRVARQVRAIGVPQAEIASGMIGPRELSELILLLLELRAWEQLVPDAMPVPDESRAYLTIRVGGYRSDIWERFNEMQINDRLLRIRDRLAAL